MPAVLRRLVSPANLASIDVVSYYPGSWLGALSTVCSDPLRKAFHDFDFHHDNPSLRAGEIASCAQAFLISHAHLDHILGMVLGSASLPGRRPVFGLKSTLDNLLGIFDGKLWPKLASYREEQPFIVYHLRPIDGQQVLHLDDTLSTTPFVLSHGLIPAVLPAPPTPTPAMSMSRKGSYFGGKRLSLPLSDLAATNANPALQSSASLSPEDRPIFNSPFAPSETSDKADIVVEQPDGSSDLQSDDQSSSKDVKAGNSSAQGVKVAHTQLKDSKVPDTDQVALTSKSLQSLRMSRRPKTASGSETAAGRDEAVDGPVSPHDATPGYSTNNSNGGNSLRVRRAGAPKRVSIDRGHQTHAALDSTAFFLTHKRTGKDVLFFGDVEPDCIARSPRNKRVWQHTASRFAAGKLHTMFLECSFPAAHPTEFLWGHLSVNHLYEELMVLARCTKSEKAVQTRRAKMSSQNAGASVSQRTRSGSGNLSPTTPRSAAMIPPSPLAAATADTQELQGILKGLTVIIIHVKQALFPSYAEATTNGDAESTETPVEPLLDPRTMQERIQQELDELDRERGLGVRFVVARQGMRIET